MAKRILVPFATRGRGCIGRALLGSVAEQKAPTAVALYRAERERTA